MTLDAGLLQFNKVLVENMIYMHINAILHLVISYFAVTNGKLVFHEHS